MAILPDNRVTASVRLVAVTPGASASADLIADTGAGESVMPDHALASVLKHAALGPVVTFIAVGSSVSTTMANGLTAEADTQPHGGGAVSTASSTLAVAIHYLAPGAAPFTGFDGILGMDLLDSFGADSVKDHTATVAYLAKRA